MIVCATFGTHEDSSARRFTFNFGDFRSLPTPAWEKLFEPFPTRLNKLESITGEGEYPTELGVLNRPSQVITRVKVLSTWYTTRMITSISRPGVGKENAGAFNF